MLEVQRLVHNWVRPHWGKRQRNDSSNGDGFMRSPYIDAGTPNQAGICFHPPLANQYRGGYNTVYECAALRIPLIAFAMPRRYDRQEVRLSNLNVQKVKTIEEATFAVCYYLNINNCDRQPNFINGAVEAADLIEQVYSTRP